MSWHLADMFDAIARLVPDRLALIEGRTRRTWKDYEDRSARLATALKAIGIEPDSKVAIYGLNSIEFLEAQYAIFKARSVPINVNYRYIEDELAYLLHNSDAEAVFFDAHFGPRLAQIRNRLPSVKTFIRIDDCSGESLNGALDFETLIATHAPLPALNYDENDIYIVYTGGTTGMPKGVMYRHCDSAPGIAAWRLGADVEPTPEALLEMVEQMAAENRNPIVLPACPLMHGTGMWLGAISTHLFGGTVALMRKEKFDPHEMLDFTAREGISGLVIVGDAFARPLLAALRDAKASGRSYDLPALKFIYSSGAMFSSETKLGLLEFADVEIVDAMSSSEGGMGGSVLSRSTPPSETARFTFNSTTKVFDENDEEVKPGSGVIGMIANGGTVPVGYYKDPEKSAKTFRTIRGKRYAFPGDFAQVAEDGSLILLGRGSACINTGGEKVFPEEVEEVLKAHESVWDVLVVGVPDDRFGEQVVAVVSATAGYLIDEIALKTFAANRLAGYKLPRRFVIKEKIQRAANGKADYQWAKATAQAEVL